MTTMFQESSIAVERSMSLGFDGPGRPRAATVSFRYTVPQSPIYKPSVSPPHSPPSLILPPVGLRSGCLSRSISRLSCVDERLASSAPSTSQLLFSECDDSDACRLDPLRSIRNDISGQADHMSDFTLLEEDDPISHQGYFNRRPSNLNHLQIAGEDISAFSGDDARKECIDSEFNSFSASPVLISCLRDIAKTRRVD